MVAVAHRDRRLSVWGRDGIQIVKRRTPYSFWQRHTGCYQVFGSLAWSRDERRIAIGATECVWLYHLGDGVFQSIPIMHPELTSEAAALFVP